MPPLRLALSEAAAIGGAGRTRRTTGPAFAGGAPPAFARIPTRHDPAQRAAMRGCLAVNEAQEEKLAALMVAAQAGDAAAYRSLLHDCAPLVIAVARRQAVPPDKVDDVVQEVLLSVHRARATYDPARPFLPWLRAIAQRRAIDLMRRHGRSTRREVSDPVSYESYAAPPHDAGAALDRSGQARTLAQAIATLPAGQRQAVERLALAEQSLAEAAAATGRSKVALKVNLHRAIRSLRSRLAKGGTDDV